MTSFWFSFPNVVMSICIVIFCGTAHMYHGGVAYDAVETATPSLLNQTSSGTTGVTGKNS